MPNIYASKWEADYARLLEARERVEDIAGWVYEPFRVTLAPRTTYAPDFMIVHRNRTIEIVEVKGHMREDAAVKFKMAAHLFPWFTWRMIRKVKGEWVDVPGFVFQGGIPVKVQRVVPTQKAVPIATPRAPMTYAQMQRHPELGAILVLKPQSFRELRVRLNLAPHDMAERIGMTVKGWVNIESGQSKIYHYRHVLAVKKLMEETV